MRRIGLAFILFWLIWGALWVLLQQGSVRREPLVVWFADASARYLVPVEWQDAVAGDASLDTRLAEVVKRLRGPVPAGLASPLEGLLNAEVKRVAGQEPQLVLRVKTGQGSAAETLLVGALVRSLASVANPAWQVRLVGPEGQALESQHLDLGAPVRAETFENRLDGARGALAVRLWLRLPKCPFLVPCVCDLRPVKGIPAQDALLMLQDGPDWSKFGLRGPISDDCRMEWRGVDGAVARLVVQGGSAPLQEQQVAMVAVVNTLLGVAGIEGVHLAFAGASTPPVPFDWHWPVRRREGVAPYYLLPAAEGPR